MTAAASFVDLVEELMPVRGCFIEDSEDEELYPAPFWILPTVAAALIAHGSIISSQIIMIKCATPHARTYVSR